MDERMTIHEFIALYKITGQIDSIPYRPDGINWGVNHWKVTLKCGNRQMTVYYSGGSAATDIDIWDVLNSLADDSGAYDNARDEIDFMRDFGYENAAEAGRIYRACGRSRNKLYKFLGEDAYNQLLWGVARL